MTVAATSTNFDLVVVHVAVDVGGLVLTTRDRPCTSPPSGSCRSARTSPPARRTESKRGCRCRGGWGNWRRGHTRCCLADLRLVAHAQRAARHFHAGTGLARTPVAFPLSIMASIWSGGAIHRRVGKCPTCRRAPCRRRGKWPILVMHEPMKTSSILSPDFGQHLTSSGSFGQATIGS